jgi:apolipoprotein N-acyltransferase
MESLHNRTKHLPTILSGSWLYKDNNLHNTMTILGTKQHYIKRHLVPFGEYVPFESILRGLIEFFDMPMSSLQEGPNHQPYFNLNNFKILGLICFDIAFPLSFRSEIKNADFIINISNDTWFGNSYGPYQHLQIVRARALESNKWIARGTSDGISTIVDNKGTIVDLLPKNARDTLYGTIFRTNNSTFFFNYGYLFAPLLSLILLVSFFVIRYKK